MTPNLMSVLNEVNSHVNLTICPQRDTADTWQRNPSAGDCEDYVLTMRSLLVRHGISAGALRIAYTHTRRGEPYAVLVVRTNQADYVLDNFSSSVKTLRATGCSILSMFSKGPNRWVAG